MSFIIVFHGPIYSKRKFDIGREQKNESSFQRHKYAISETESVDQPLAETTSTETKQPPQKCQADNQWRVARRIVSRDNMVQQNLFRCYMTYPHFPPRQSPLPIRLPHLLLRLFHRSATAAPPLRQLNNNALLIPPLQNFTQALPYLLSHACALSSSSSRLPSGYAQHLVHCPTFISEPLLASHGRCLDGRP